MELVFDIKLLDNLQSLHEQEEDLRRQSLELIAGDQHHSELMFLVTNAMNVLFGFTHDHVATTDDELTLQYFGLRLFNDAACSMKLALSGYAQQAMGQARDIMEIGFLLDYFRTAPQEISAWKNASAKVRKSKFGPVHIRKALDARDGNKEMKRARVYAMLSEHASHATYPGFRLMMKDGHGQVGPFIDDVKLRAWLQELTLRLLPAAELLGAHFPNAAEPVRELYRLYRGQIMEWWQRQQAARDAKQGDTTAPGGK
ncbi:MAG: hypothetical protein WCE79_14115 [Xanthobacteraceae bacterium]